MENARVLKMKRKIFLLIMMVLMTASLVTAGSVTRSFNPSTAERGGTVVVTLNVDVEAGDSFYAIQENIPAGWTVTSATPVGNSDLDFTSDVSRFLVTRLNNPVDVIYTYTLNVPASASATTTFSGDVGFGETSISIVGSTSLAVVDAAAGNPCDGVTCLNGGSCSAGSCVCVNGYSGSECQTPPSCTPNWQCAWSNVADSCGTYNCVDANGCGGTAGRPANSGNTQTCPQTGTCAGDILDSSYPECDECPSGKDLLVFGDGSKTCDDVLQDVRNAALATNPGTEDDLTFVSRIAGALRGFFSRIFG
jgi:uncharacterized protein YcnI